MKYGKIQRKAGGEAMNTDTVTARNIRVADEKAGGYCRKRVWNG